MSAGDNRLVVLAAEIRDAHAGVEDAARTAAERAIEAGHRLIEAKELTKHGEWLPWLQEHCQLSERTAQRYMRLASSGLKADIVADLGVAGADAAIAVKRGDDLALLTRRAETINQRIWQLTAAEVAKEGLDRDASIFTTFMRMKGCRGTYGSTGASFPNDLTEVEWIHIGRVMRTLPGYSDDTGRP